MSTGKIIRLFPGDPRVPRLEGLTFRDRQSPIMAAASKLLEDKPFVLVMRAEMEKRAADAYLQGHALGFRHGFASAGPYILGFFAVGFLIGWAL